MRYDIRCFSHLRWDGVYQRPQHVLSRFAPAEMRAIVAATSWETTVRAMAREIACVVSGPGATDA
jgi:hypothetical protein